MFKNMVKVIYIYFIIYLEFIFLIVVVIVLIIWLYFGLVFVKDVVLKWCFLFFKLINFLCIKNFVWGEIDFRGVIC